MVRKPKDTTKLFLLLRLGALGVSVAIGLPGLFHLDHEEALIRVLAYVAVVVAALGVIAVCAISLDLPLGSKRP